MHAVSRRTRTAIAGLSAAIALAAPLAGQADAATKTVRLEPLAKAGQSLRSSGSQVNLAPTGSGNDQRWVKTDVGFGFATYRSVATERCLQSTSGSFLASTAPCTGSSAQQWSRGFSNDKRIENRLSRRALTFNPSSFTQIVADFFAAKPGQRWLEPVV